MMGIRAVTTYCAAIGASTTAGPSVAADPHSKPRVGKNGGRPF
jgi:hypothetical protein